MAQQITITIRQGEAWTNMDHPRVGRALTAEESSALHAVTALASAGLRVHYGANALHTLAEDLLNPERFGYSVTAEVRDAARRATGRPAVETAKGGAE